MSTTTIDEFVSEINRLADADRAELLRRLNQSRPKSGKPQKQATNGKKRHIDPNTIWMREHSSPYGGQYVALENGELVGIGKGYPDTLANARRAGAVRPLITYVPREDEELFGGW